MTHGRAPSLTQAILNTLTYADLFDHALTRYDTHRYLQQRQASPQAITNGLDQLASTQAIAQYGELYTLPNRAHLIDLRAEREAYARQLWPLAWRYGRWLANIPFTRMIAVTGSLAVNNPDSQADIDYMLITAPNRVWLTRLLTLIPVHYAQNQGVELCPNFLLSKNALALQPQNIYTARELAQMIPLAGRDVYQQLRQANLWTADFFPNANGQPRTVPNSPIPPLQKKHRSESLLNGPLGDHIENWERSRKIAKFTAQGLTNETAFSATQCKGHFDNHQNKTLNKLSSSQNSRMTPKTDILFGQSYYLRFDPKLWEMMQPYPPLGTMYAAAYLR